MTCKKAREFLSKKKMDVEIIDIRKNPVSAHQTLKIVRGAQNAVAIKGKKIITLDLSKNGSSQKEILDSFLGRSNTMRAPVLIVGNHIVGGFDAQTYSAILK
jgi:arsenate reductase-like glutaredoxin family protein